ncbi:MAG: hypothetical protein ACKOHN_06370, partial [Actinomycetota bacterium]
MAVSLALRGRFPSAVCTCGVATRHVHTAAGNGPVNALDTALRAAVSQAHPPVDRIHQTDYQGRI